MNFLPLPQSDLMRKAAIYAELLRPLANLYAVP